MTNEPESSVDEEKSLSSANHASDGTAVAVTPSAPPSIQDLAAKHVAEPPAADEPSEAALTATATDSASAAPEETRTRMQTTVIMLSLCSAMFLVALDVTIITVAIPTIAGDFNSTVGYTWIGSSYLLANAAAAPSWGKISDIWGRKQVLLIAVAIFWVGSLLCATSVNMSMLIASRAIQGIGGGGIIILVNVCISDLFSIRKRGQYFGLMGLVWAVAGTLGPVIGGAFTSHVSWKWCFWLNLPISGVGFFVLLFVLKLHNPRTSMRDGLAALDWLGSLTAIGGTLMILLGLTFGDVVFPWRSATVICLIVFGLVAAALFVVVESRFSKFPIIPMRLFKKRVAVASFGCCFVHGFVFISGSYYLPLYFQAVLGASPLLSGVYVLPFSVVISVCSALTGFIIQKTGKYLVLIIGGFAFLTFGFGLFIDLGADKNWAKLVMYQVIAAIGVGSNFQSSLISLQTTVQPRDIASATATYGFIRQLATSISVVVGGVVFQNGMQRQHASLVASIGSEAASLLTGNNAAASVYLIEDLPPAALATARIAYWKSLRSMYILYAAMAGFGLFVSCFVGQTKLSKVHKEHKTGLVEMREEWERDVQARKQQKEGRGEA